MTALGRINQMLSLADTQNRIFPATTLYNEGWLLRLVLDWFSRQQLENHDLSFASGGRWFSEARLPSQFFARYRGDQFAEGWTNADGVVGHVLIGDATLANAKLADDATQFVVTEAKLYSPLSSRVTNASYFDQAARSVACIAEVLFKANRRPEGLPSLGFFLIAPSDQIARNLFKDELSKESIKTKVLRRVAAYTPPDREKKEVWQRDWFLPTLLKVKIKAFCWEEIVDFIHSNDSTFGSELSDFYSKCRKFNRAQEPEVSMDIKRKA